MEEEAVCGPDLFGSVDESDVDDDSEIDNETLHQYKKARLRYYYDDINCDSSAIVDYLYKACDGAKFERTSNVMDLGFIPDDMEFNHPPRDVATEIPIGYEAPDFHTRALQHNTVNISWDDDEPPRVKTFNRKYDPKQLNEMDFKAYLALVDDVSDSDEDEKGEDGVDDEKKKDVREKYGSPLLDSGDPSEGREDNDDKDMEITFNTGLEKASKKHSKSKPSSSELKSEEDASKAELELLLADDHGLEKSVRGYNLKSNKSKYQKVKEPAIEDKLPTVDPRFSAPFTSHHFAIDPTNHTVTCTSLNGSVVSASVSELMKVQCEVKDESSMLEAKVTTCPNPHSIRNKSLGKSNKLHVHNSDEPISCSQSEQLAGPGDSVVKGATQFSALVGRTSRPDDGLQSYKKIPLGQKQIEDPLQASKDVDDLIHKSGTKVLQQRELGSTQIKSGSINHGIHSSTSLSNLEESVENFELWVFQSTDIRTEILSL